MIKDTTSFFLLPLFQALALGDFSTSAVHEAFPEFLRRLQTYCDQPGKFSSSLKTELLDCLTSTVWNNEAAIKHWQRMYILCQCLMAASLFHTVDVRQSRSSVFREELNLPG